MAPSIDSKDSGDGKNSNDETSLLLSENFMSSAENRLQPNSDSYNSNGRKPMPKAIFFIVGNEFCERFSFYGMKAILAVYLVEWINISQSSATLLVHFFNFFAYFFSLAGAIIADSWLGKYKTILYLSVVYCFGNIIFAFSSFPKETHAEKLAFTGVGLILIAIGTGGIKPCVASFGGDQFDLRDVMSLSSFFAMFYFAINAGSVLSMFLTPILSKDISCFGQPQCYPLAFGLPALLMMVALAIFVFGSSFYKHAPCSQNMILMLFNVFSTAIKEKFAAADRSKPLLEYARDHFPSNLISDLADCLKVLGILLPTPLFWTLYDQQSSKWIYQAMKMNNSIGFYEIKPGQMQVVNAVMILAFIPLFDWVIYPLIARCGIRFGQLHRMVAGMALAAISFVVASIVEYRIDQSTFVPIGNDSNVQKCVENCVNVMWQLPQFALITAGEVLFSITGVEFAYSQAPLTMKSLCQSFWLLTVAIGNLIVVLVEAVNVERLIRKYQHKDAIMYLAYAMLGVIGMLVLWQKSTTYKMKQEVLILPEEEQT